MVKSITSANFDAHVLEGSKPTVVEVYTNSCPNCKILAPVIEATEQENTNKYNFYKLNARKNMDIAKRYKVLGVPTLLFFSHGILVDKKTGITSQQKIEKRLTPLLSYTKDKALQNERKGYFKLPWK